MFIPESSSWPYRTEIGSDMVSLEISILWSRLLNFLAPVSTYVKQMIRLINKVAHMKGLAVGPYVCRRCAESFSLTIADDLVQLIDVTETLEKLKLLAHGFSGSE